MADAPNPALQECATCGTLIDVTEEQPLALRHCPNCGGAMRVRRIFNHFELEEVLGAGGMGAVYRALDTNLHRPVALKLLRAEHSQSPELIASFAKEAAITASINHPHVVRVYSTGTDHGIFYIAMELVDKGSLDDLMALQGKVGEMQVLEVGIQIAQGLQAAHQRGLIHRDVKPGNILFADAHNAKIVDFGLAVLQEHANTDGGAVWGTPYYVAPEKLDAVPREDFRSDMYSLGATLFHALTGRPPFEAETVSMVTLKHLKSQMVSIQSFAPDVSNATAYVINKTLQKDPDKRFATYEELIENLRYARDQLTAAAGRRRHDAAHAPASTAWITLTTAALVIATGLTAHHYRDRILGTPRQAAEPPAPEIAAPAFERIYKEAQQQIAAGKYAEAAAALRALESGAPAPQPLRNWIGMHAALAHFLAGQADEAGKDLQTIAARGIYTPDPAEQAIAQFFVKLAQLGAADAAVPVAAAEAFDPSSDECFALLLLASKDWARGAFEDAGGLFERFLAATPDEASTWVEETRPIATARMAQLAVYRDLSGAQTSSEIAILEKALEAAKSARTKADAIFTSKVGELEATLTRQLAAAQEAKAKRDAEMDAAEAKLVADALARMNAAYGAFKFTDAARILDEVTLATEPRKLELAGWKRRTEWLASFKAGLINDINTLHYSQPLTRRNGTSIPSGLGKASEATAEMVTPYGNVPVPWTDLSIESVNAMAQSFLRLSPQTTAGDRWWQLGVFMYTFGRRAEALPLLRQGADARPDYQPHLALFPET